VDQPQKYFVLDAPLTYNMRTKKEEGFDVFNKTLSYFASSRKKMGNRGIR
jgi:hypothetical protein